jgi:hypothetical protein
MHLTLLFTDALCLRTVVRYLHVFFKCMKTPQLVKIQDNYTHVDLIYNVNTRQLSVLNITRHFQQIAVKNCYTGYTVKSDLPKSNLG